MSYPPAYYHIPPGFDVYDNDQVSVSHTHEQIHQGEASVVSMVVTMTAESTMQCQITTPASPIRIHFVLNCQASGNGITVTFYEGCQSTSGTPVAIMNRNRNSAKVTGATFVHTPAVSTTGTAIYTTYLAASKQGGSVDHGTDEFVLLPNTRYLINLTVDAGQSAVFAGRGEWYETDTNYGE